MRQRPAGGAPGLVADTACSAAVGLPVYSTLHTVDVIDAAVDAPDPLLDVGQCQVSARHLKRLDPLVKVGRVADD